MATPEPTIQDVLAAIDALRVAVMGRIDRLQDTVTGMRDDIHASYGRSDRAYDATTGVARQVEAMGREISAMERQIQRLQADVRTLKGED